MLQNTPPCSFYQTLHGNTALNQSGHPVTAGRLRNPAVQDLEAPLRLLRPEEIGGRRRRRRRRGQEEGAAQGGKVIYSTVDSRFNNFHFNNKYHINNSYSGTNFVVYSYGNTQFDNIINLAICFCVKSRIHCTNWTA